MAEAAPPDSVLRPGVGVRSDDAQRLRVALGDAGLLDHDVQPERAAGRVWFPLVDGATGSSVRQAIPSLADLRIEARPFRVRAKRLAHYTERLTDLPSDLQELLPTSYDVIGHVVIIKLPDGLSPHEARIGQALLDTHANVRTVARDRGVTGELRVRALDVIAGEPALTTTHKEHGLEIEVALDKVYFSPRLATERRRLAERIRPGQRVLDLFAGVGAFVCLAAKQQRPGEMCAIDLNHEAVELLHRNLDRNRIEHEVDVREGDARRVAPRTRDWDHVVMNLPHDAIRFLDVAAECVAPHGEVHLYAMVERADHDRFVTDLETRMTHLMGGPWEVVAERHVRNYAPTMDGLGFTLRAPGAS